MLRDSLDKCQQAIKTARSRYFSDVIESFFSTIDSFLNPRLEAPGDIPMELCESLLEFFLFFLFFLGVYLTYERIYNSVHMCLCIHL